MTLCSLCAMYALENDVSSGYVDQIKLAVSRFGKFLGREPMLSDLQDETVNQWLASLLETGLSRRTVRSKRGHLLVLWRFAYRDDLVEHGPRRVRKINCQKIIPEASTPEIVGRLLDVATTIKGSFRRSKVPRAQFWIAFILVAWESGLRLGDLMKLRRDSISAKGVLAITQNKTNWPKICLLSGECLAAIEATYPPKRERIFGDAISKRRAQELFADIAKAAGFQGGTKRIRKSGATEVERMKPGSAMAYLGHQTPGLAYQFYVDPRLSQPSGPKPTRICGGQNPAELLPPLEPPT